MAKIYPDINPQEIRHVSEQVVYKSLQNLSDEYVIFYSVPWLRYNKGRANTWYENDFVILHKRMGMLVLEVKGGEIEFVDGVIHQTNTDNGFVSVLNLGNDPLEQARRGIYFYINEFEKSIPDIKNKLGINPLIWFPGVKIIDDSLFPQHYRNISKAVFDNDAFDNINKYIMLAFNNYNSKDNTNLTDDEFNKIKQILAPSFKLTTSHKFERGQIEEKFLLLTKEQNTLLDYISEIRLSLIQGAAGTGKTLLAVEAAKRNAEEQKKVLFLCYNSFLIKDIKNANPITGVDYFTIDSFVLFHSYSYNDDPILLNSKERAEKFNKLEEVLSQYECIIVDEAQDFEDSEIEFLQALSAVYEIKTMLFYDKNQIIYRSNIPNWIKNSECKLLLTKNCRNTFEIACTSYNVIDNEIKRDLTGITGEQPKIVFSNNMYVDLERLIKYYLSDLFDFSADDITILTLETEQKSFINDINYIDNYKISRERKQGCIFFTSARKFKGLESRVVILIDINEHSFSDEKKLFYVACSRARHNLAMIININEIDSIAKCIDLPIKNNNKKISVKTKTKVF